jgi:hypothetical protein
MFTPVHWSPSALQGHPEDGQVTPGIRALCQKDCIEIRLPTTVFAPKLRFFRYETMRNMKRNFS